MWKQSATSKSDLKWCHQDGHEQHTHICMSWTLQPRDVIIMIQRFVKTLSMLWAGRTSRKGENDQSRNSSDFLSATWKPRLCQFPQNRHPPSRKSQRLRFHIRWDRKTRSAPVTSQTWRLWSIQQGLACISYQPVDFMVHHGEYWK